jgi:flagellar motility protein MotE (MotC chaperone)
VPIGTTETGSEAQLLERLSQRREELEKLQTELEMRESLLQAAEQQIEQQSASLKGIQEQLGGDGSGGTPAEKEQMAALVTMYEAMKPKEAAIIFSQLDMPTLLKVTRAMNPRKKGPILARMDTPKAQALTAALAAAPALPVAEAAAGSDVGNLPQIVGQ